MSGGEQILDWPPERGELCYSGRRSSGDSGVVVKVVDRARRSGVGESRGSKVHDDAT